MSLPVVPSYVVSAFDEETLILSKELEALGGGDAKIFNAEAHTIVVGPDDDDDGHDSTNQTLWVKDNRIGFRNTSLSKTEPIAKSVKYFTFDSVSKINNVVDNPDRYQLVEDLKNHMLSGFNGTVIAVGEKGTGKTRTLFGASPPSITSDIVRIQDLPSSIVSSLLRLLYTHKNTSNELVTIALSVWAIRGSQLVDLLSPSSSSESSMEFAVIECLDVKTAMQVISSARDRMPGVLCHPREPLQDCHKEPLHFFLRIILHTSAKSNTNNGFKNSVSADRMPHANPFKTGTSNKTRSDSGRLSILTIVDLVGKLTDSDIAAPVSDDIRVLRRRTNLGLVALSRVMTLIKKAHKTSSDKSNENPVFPANTSITLTPARDSTLTSVLTPMLVGNSKLFFMPFIRDGTKHSVGTYDTLALAQGINGILSATFRHTGVSLHDLNMKPPSHCLGPFIVNPFATNTHAVTNNNTAMNINATTTTNKDTLMTSTTKSKIVAKVVNDNDSFSTLLEQAQSVSVINKTIIDRINEINTSTNASTINASTINASTSIDDNINTKINTNDDNDDITFSTSSKEDNIASLRTNNTTIYTITDINTGSISYLSNYKNKSKHKTR